MSSIFRCYFVACQLLFLAVYVQAQTNSKPLTLTEIARQSDDWYGTPTGLEYLERIITIKRLAVVVQRFTH